MIQVNQLRVTPDGRFLIVDIAVKNIDAYRNVYIKHLKIDSQDTFVEGRPSEETIYSYDATIQRTDEGEVEEITGVKNLSLRLSKKDFSQIETISGTLFFVYVIVGISSNCGKEDVKKLFVATHLHPMYKVMMSYINEMEGCSVPNGLIDSILRLQCLEAAIKSGRYDIAIKYWKEFSEAGDSLDTSVSNLCGCYGEP